MRPSIHWEDPLKCISPETRVCEGSNSLGGPCGTPSPADPVHSQNSTSRAGCSLRARLRVCRLSTKTPSSSETPSSGGSPEGPSVPGPWPRGPEGRSSSSNRTGKSWLSMAVPGPTGQRQIRGLVAKQQLPRFTQAWSQGR